MLLNLPARLAGMEKTKGVPQLRINLPRRGSYESERREMKQQDRENLMALLTNLLTAQDNITYEFSSLQEIREATAARNDIKNQIIAFVSSLIETPTKEGEK